MPLAQVKKPSLENASKRKNGISYYTPDHAPSIRSNFSTQIISHQRACPCGGGCPRCKDNLPIQTKLKINEPGDKYEQEADRIADQVMRMTDEEVLSLSRTDTNIQRKCVECSSGHDLCPECAEEEEGLQLKPLGSAIAPLLQRQAESEIEEEDEEELIQTKVDSEKNPETVSNLGSQIQSLKGGGQPLPKSVLYYFEPRFGYDFSKVRVHTDSPAKEVTQAVNAKAFTVGRDVVFGASQYSPEKNEGRKLLAHELAHVVQQRPLGSSLKPASRLFLNRTSSTEEYESKRVTNIVRHGLDADRLSISHTTPGPVLQRELSFTVTELGGSGIANRFMALINRLLPYGWEFSISPLPGLAITEGGAPAYISGDGRLVQTDPFGTLEQQSHAWQRRFRTALANFINSPQTSSFRLTTGGEFFVGSFLTGHIDVADLEQLPPVTAATFLIHEFDESLGYSRGTGDIGQEFDVRHALAIVGEAEVMGGERLEREALTRPRGIDPDHPPPEDRWEFWIPFRLPNGFIRALVTYLRGNTVLGGRMAGFTSIAQFRRDVPA